MSDKNHQRLLFYLKSRYLGHLNWVGEFPDSITFKINNRDQVFACEGTRDWSNGQEALYVEEGMSDELRRKVAVGCKVLKGSQSSEGRSLGQHDHQFLSSLGVRW